MRRLRTQKVVQQSIERPHGHMTNIRSESYGMRAECAERVRRSERRRDLWSPNKKCVGAAPSVWLKRRVSVPRTPDRSKIDEGETVRFWTNTPRAGALIEGPVTDETKNQGVSGTTRGRKKRPKVALFDGKDARGRWWRQ